MNLGGAWDRPQRIAVGIGLIGIALEVIAVALLASKRIPTNIGVPVAVAGMFLAFVPILVLSRRRRRKR
ncbi:MAG: hypothetical protein ABI779_10170 [Acidobacteriota bacterium]